MTRLDGRMALVTGAGRGIGLAISERLRADGARVVMLDRDARAVEGAASGSAITSVFLVCRAAVRLMRPRGSGRIVNIASIAGKEGNTTLVPYSTAKAGTRGAPRAHVKSGQDSSAGRSGRTSVASLKS
jgi:NAD(P)-dependent dehydrogenase (short-subunit alcohol dehydrogenase family)